MNVFDFEAVRSDGTVQQLGEYRGRVLLIVNTATRCGFTPQLEGLEKLHAAFRDQGFAVLGFPCNQFAGQAPETDEDIGAFCRLKYGVSFPTFAKVAVNGRKAHPLFKHLKKRPARGRSTSSNGTSPSFSSAETASPSSGFRRRRRPKPWKRTYGNGCNESFRDEAIRFFGPCSRPPVACIRQMTPSAPNFDRIRARLPAPPISRSATPAARRIRLRRLLPPASLSTLRSVRGACRKRAATAPARSHLPASPPSRPIAGGRRHSAPSSRGRLPAPRR